MKPPPFEYARPDTVEEALTLLSDAGEDAHALAGGQSLVPLLNMRFARPTLVVDLGRVASLASLEWVNGHVRIGAMVRQRTLETDARVRERIPLLTEAARHIAHIAIRMRGTIGGSLAHADPAAELPATAIVLDATFAVRGPAGRRTVPAADFFLGPYTTALGAGELLEAVEVPVSPAGAGYAFLENARVHGAFALAGVAALVRLGADGRIAAARLGLCGVGGVPYAPEWLDEIAVGEAADEPLFARIAERVQLEVEPSGDAQAGPAYRRRLAGVLTRRALALATERART